MRRGHFVERLPIYACAGFIGFLFLANLWNFAVERDWPKLRIRSADQLAGVPAPTPAPWTLDAILSGDTQRAVSTNLGQNSPVFRISVRVKNQFLYSLFRASGAANIVVGRNDQLYATGYIDEFCARGAPTDGALLSHWADGVAEIATLAKARGKGFLFLVSPSKAAHDPQFLPPGRSCPALAKQPQEKLAPFRAALAERSAPFVDSAKLLREEQANYPIDFFPRGGIHWNELGAALTMREMTRVLESQPPGSPIGEFAFEWREDDEAKGWDRDLLDLLNLFWPDNHYPTAVVTGRNSGALCERKPRLLVVGSSFLRGLIVIAAQTPCPPEIDYWFYRRDDNTGAITLARYFTQAGDTSNGRRIEADLADLPASFSAADAIVLEENEAVIGKTKQVDNLLAAARAAQ